MKALIRNVAIMIASMAFVFYLVWLHFDVDKTRHEVEQLRIERNSLLIRVADLQSRVDAQQEIDRRAESELLRHADQTQSLMRSHEIEESMRAWEDAGRPKVTSWGEFWRQQDAGVRAR